MTEKDADLDTENQQSEYRTYDRPTRPGMAVVSGIAPPLVTAIVVGPFALAFSAFWPKPVGTIGLAVMFAIAIVGAAVFIAVDKATRFDHER